MTQTINTVAQLTDEELVNEIYLNHHQPERELINELDVLINRVLLAHYLHGKETVLMLHRNISQLRLELQALFAKEEKELFRAIRKADRTVEENDDIRKNILERTEDQKKIVAILDEIFQNTNGFTPPEYACGTMTAVYTKLQELKDDLSTHLSMENDILFKRFN